MYNAFNGLYLTRCLSDFMFSDDYENRKGGS